ATAATAATAGRLMAATLLVAMAVLAVTAARRSEDLAAPEEMAALVASAASWRGTRRSEAPAAMRLVPERAALAATLLTEMAALAATAATAGRLMAASRLVGMAVREAVTAAGRSEDLAAPEEMGAW